MGNENHRLPLRLRIQVGPEPRALSGQLPLRHEVVFTDVVDEVHGAVIPRVPGRPQVPLVVVDTAAAKRFARVVSVMASEAVVERNAGLLTDFLVERHLPLGAEHRQVAGHREEARVAGHLRELCEFGQQVRVGEQIAELTVAGRQERELVSTGQRFRGEHEVAAVLSLCAVARDGLVE